MSKSYYDELGIKPNRLYTTSKMAQIVGKTDRTIRRWIAESRNGTFAKPFDVVLIRNGQKQLVYKIKGSEILKVYIYFNGYPL